MKVKEYAGFILLSLLSGGLVVMYFETNFLSAFLFLIASHLMLVIGNHWLINIVFCLYFNRLGYKMLCVNIYPFIFHIENKKIYLSGLSLIELYSCIDFDYLQDSCQTLKKYYSDYLRVIKIIRYIIYSIMISFLILCIVINIYLSLYFFIIEACILYFYYYQFFSTNTKGFLCTYNISGMEMYVWPLLPMILSHTYLTSISYMIKELDVNNLSYPCNLLLEYIIYQSIVNQKEHLDDQIIEKMKVIISDDSKFSFMLENQRFIITYFMYMYNFHYSLYDTLLMEYYNHFISLFEDDNIFVKNYYYLKNRLFARIHLYQLFYPYNHILTFKNKIELVKQTLIEKTEK